MLNWIVWNRTDYLYKNGCHKAQAKKKKKKKIINIKYCLYTVKWFKYCNLILIILFISRIRTVWQNWIVWNSNVFWQLNRVHMLNWIVWNRTDYSHKNGFGAK